MSFRSPFENSAEKMRLFYGLSDAFNCHCSFVCETEHNDAKLAVHINDLSRRARKKTPSAYDCGAAEFMCSAIAYDRGISDCSRATTWLESNFSRFRPKIPKPRPHVRSDSPVPFKHLLTITIHLI